MRLRPLALLLLPGLLTLAVSAAPLMEVSPREVVEGEAVAVKISGLDAGQKLVLRATRMYHRYPTGAEPYRSTGVFTANEQGRVDLARDAAEAGSSYTGVDPAGLFWSMVADRLAVTPPDSSALFDPRTLPPGTGMLELEIDGQIVGRQPVRCAADAAVNIEEIRAPGLTGFFAARPAAEPLPAIILLGGSEGGLFTARCLAPLLASHGYAVLGVAYFQGGEPDLASLRPNLAEIPVETLETAYGWLKRQPAVDADRLALVGVSKGAEFALVAATIYPWVDAVAAFAPSHVVWEGIPENDGPARPPMSSWTLDGRPLPFVRWSYAAEERGAAARTATGRSRLTEAHLESLARFAADVPAARIPLERSRAALFIVAGVDDGMWPSAFSAGEIERSLPRDASRLVRFEMPATGHQILGTGWAPTTTFQRSRGRLQGGSAELDARAQAAVWPKLLQFLEQTLK